MARDRRSCHWASKCKLNFTQDFTQKNIPFEKDIADVKRDELKALGTFFGIDEHDDEEGDSEEQAALNRRDKPMKSFEKTMSIKNFAMRWRKNAQVAAKLAQPPQPADADVGPTPDAEDGTYVARTGSKDDEVVTRQKSEDSARVRTKFQRSRETNLVGKGDLLNQAAKSTLEQLGTAASSTLPPMSGSDGTQSCACGTLSRETATTRASSSPYSSESSQRQEGGKHDEREGRTKDSARGRPKIQFALKDEKEALELPGTTTYTLEALPSIYGSEASRQDSKKLRSLPTEEEIDEAKPPEPLGMDNFPPLYQRMSEKKQETHYDYFGRHLPTESPRRREAMRLRTEVARKSYHTTTVADVEDKMVRVRTGRARRRLPKADVQDNPLQLPGSPK